MSSGFFSSESEELACARTFKIFFRTCPTVLRLTLETLQYAPVLKLGALHNADKAPCAAFLLRVLLLLRRRMTALTVGDVKCGFVVGFADHE